MPTKSEKDKYQATQTTGHEWDGIQELDTPLPKWWLYVFYACIAWSLVYFVLYPAWPGFNGYTRGLLGWSMREEIQDKLAEARAQQAKYVDRINAVSVEEIRKDKELLDFSLVGGRATFADNCAPCHSVAGTGRKAFPALTDDVWIWGGTLKDIEKTIAFGVRSEHRDARQSIMPSFGVDGVLKPTQIDDVAEYVLSLNRRSTDAAAAKRGEEIFRAQCVACHGDKAQGKIDQGAPPLMTQIWLYGGSKSEIVAQINKPQLGVMPAWSGRLDPATIKMLTIYVHSLGGGK